MKKINELKRSVLLTGIIGLLLSACYEAYDPASYAPVFTISGFSSVKQIEPAHLVGYWGFENSLVDSVSNTPASNHGSTFDKGFKGLALAFNAANKSYVTFEPGPSITGAQSLTISFWVNPVFVDTDNDKAIDGILGLVNLSNPTGFWGNIDWFVENGSTVDAAKIVAHVVSGTSEAWMNVSGVKGFFGKWTNLTLTYDAETQKFTYYVNGSSQATDNTSLTGPITFTGSGPMVFGTVQFQTTPSLTNHGPESWASWLTGHLDEVRIYNKALTAEEVNAMVVLQGKGK